jgi:acetyltransferase
VVVKRRRGGRPDQRARGGLALDLRDGAAVADAISLLERDDAAPPGFLVQRQVGRKRELLVRVAEDELFGPTIGFGQGGTAASVFGDVAVDLPPLNLTLARALIARTQVFHALGALHDLPAANLESVAETLVRVSQLVVDFPEIAELDVNPLFADPDGVRAADAWIRLRAAEAPPGRLAIMPYPAELTETFVAGGESFVIRPIRPEDADAHGAFFARLPAEDIRYRFFSAIRQLSAEQMARLTQVDYQREIAFVAVREATGETVGVSRLVRDAGGDEGEFAVVVQPDVKGRGLARRLVSRLIDWGRERALVAVVGQVLADNAPMVAFIRRLGFEVHRNPIEASVLEARLELGGGPAARS